ncbi:hypothetical protein L7F22_046582 [Adiantum nelumboides]|nr:hypothetical protein [Adiantum nelumboides]
MAPKRATIDSSSADYSPSQSSVSMSGGHTSHMPNSSHSIKKRQPIVRIVQVRPSKVIKADLSSFRDLVHQFTGQQAASLIYEQEEAATTKVEQQKAEKVSILKSSNTISLASSPSYSSSSPYPSSVSSESESFPTGQSPRSNLNGIHTAGFSPEHGFEEYGTLLASWRYTTDYDSTSKLTKTEDLIGSMSNGMEAIYNALDSLTPLDHHLMEFSKMKLNYY